MDAASPNRTPSLELGLGSAETHYVDIVSRDIHGGIM